MDLFKTWLVEKYIAHRGFHDSESPENSITAFKKAIENGYVIELDVQEISDGTIVVFHDASLSRMTGQDGYVRYLTKADLKHCYLNNTKETIPTFEEVLNVIKGQTPIIIEIKNNSKPGKLETKLVELLKNYKGDFAIMSFNPYVLKWFKDNHPNIIRGQLSSFFKSEKLAFLKKLILKRMILNKVSNPNFIAYNAQNLPNRFVRKYKTLPLLAWTIRSQEEYMKIVKHCDNIIFEGFQPKI